MVSMSTSHCVGSDVQTADPASALPSPRLSTRPNQTPLVSRRRQSPFGICSVRRPGGLPPYWRHSTPIQARRSPVLARAPSLTDGHISAAGVVSYPPTMSTSRILQHLYSLDISSPNFPRYLYCLIQRDEEDKYLSSLQGSELARLVDFLDEVRTLPSVFPPVTKQTIQALDTIPTADDVYRQCLHKLQAICDDHMTLPSSHKVSGDLARVGDYPISVDGGTADVWEGTCGSRKVCIKCPRVSEKDLQTVTRVCTQCCHTLSASAEEILLAP